MRIAKHASLIGVFFVGLFAGPAHAEGLVEANVPFSFVIGGEKFPAGHYEIQTDGPDITLIRGTNNRAASYALTIPAADHDPIGSQPALVFTRFENTFRLSEFWITGSEGRVLEPSLSRHQGARHAGVTAAPSDTEIYVVGYFRS
jgi:hypothetical protein